MLPEGTTMARILVMDDEATAREMVRQALESRGHEVVETDDGTSGLQMLQGGGFALVVVDVMMPGKGGVETLIDIHRDFKNLKVIVISGKIDVDSDAFRRLAEHFGASRILRKPFAVQELLEAVDALLK
jgi:CheY-like chemotaxis protein